MSTRDLGFLSAALLGVGTLMPVWTVQGAGSFNVFAEPGAIAAAALLLIAVLASAMCLSGAEERLVLLGVAAGLLESAMIVRLLMGQESGRLPTARTDPLEWGWVILLLGAGLMIEAGARARVAARDVPRAPVDPIEEIAIKVAVAFAAVAASWEFLR